MLWTELISKGCCVSIHADSHPSPEHADREACFVLDRTADCLRWLVVSSQYPGRLGAAPAATTAALTNAFLFSHRHQGLTSSQIMDRTSGIGNVPCTFRNNIVRRSGEEGEWADGGDATSPREEGVAGGETSGSEEGGREGEKVEGMSDEALAELIKIYSAEEKPPSRSSEEGESGGQGAGGGEEEKEGEGERGGGENN